MHQPIQALPVKEGTLEKLGLDPVKLRNSWDAAEFRNYHEYGVMAPTQMHAHALLDAKNATIPKGTPEAEQVLLRLTTNHLERCVRGMQMPMKG